MKQYIAVEQLEELDEKQYANLIEILENNKLATYQGLEMGGEYLVDEINIGAMMTIVGYNNCLTLEQENVTPNDSDYGLKWVVRIFHDVDCAIKEYEADELVDALWDAVKSMLSN